MEDKRGKSARLRKTSVLCALFHGQACRHHHKKKASKERRERAAAMAAHHWPYFIAFYSGRNLVQALHKNSLYEAMIALMKHECGAEPGLLNQQE